VSNFAGALGFGGGLFCVGGGRGGGGGGGGGGVNWCELGRLTFSLLFPLLPPVVVIECFLGKDWVLSFICYKAFVESKGKVSEACTGLKVGSKVDPK